MEGSVSQIITREEFIREVFSIKEVFGYDTYAIPVLSVVLFDYYSQIMNKDYTIYYCYLMFRIIVKLVKDYSCKFIIPAMIAEKSPINDYEFEINFIMKVNFSTSEQWFDLIILSKLIFNIEYNNNKYITDGELKQLIMFVLTEQGRFGNNIIKMSHFIIHYYWLKSKNIKLVKTKPFWVFNRKLVVV